MTFRQSQEMTLSFYTHNHSLAQHFIVCIYHCSDHRLPNDWKIQSFHFFYWNAYVTKIEFAIKKAVMVKQRSGFIYTMMGQSP